MDEMHFDKLIREASRQMLGKDHPSGRNDWMMVINFIAWNVKFKTCLDVCSNIARVYRAPLKEKEIQEIVDFQTYDRAVRELASQEKAAGLLSDKAIQDVNDFFGDGFEKEWQRGNGSAKSKLEQ